MHHTNARGHTPTIAVLLILLLACIGLAACGGSGTSSSSNAATTAAATGASTSTSSTGSSTGSGTTAPGTAGRGIPRFAAIRECLQKNGVTLPKRTPGAGGPAGGGVFLGAAGGPQLPKGITRAQFEAALKKCGGSNFGARFGRPGVPVFRRLNSPVFRQALAKYATCLRQNGINVPAPNTSGNGPIFNTKGINTTSAQFRTASTKCRTALVGAFRRPSGAARAGAAPAGAAPPGAAASAAGESAGGGTAGGGSATAPAGGANPGGESSG